MRRMLRPGGLAVTAACMSFAVLGFAALAVANPSAGLPLTPEQVSQVRGDVQEAKTLEKLALKEIGTGDYAGAKDALDASHGDLADASTVLSGNGQGGSAAASDITLANVRDSIAIGDLPGSPAAVTSMINGALAAKDLALSHLAPGQLALELVASPSSSAGGPFVLTAGSSQTVSYSILGGRPLPPLTVSLSLGSSTAPFVITQDSCSAPSPGVPPPPKPPGPRTTCSVTVTYAGATPLSAQTAILTVTKMGPGGVAVASFFSIAAGVPSLSITNAADAKSVSAGSSVGFTVTLTNGGSGAATGVTLSDPLPGATGVSWSIDTQLGPAGCTLTGNAASQSVGCGTFTLAAGASERFHVTSLTTSASCTSLPNVASFSSGNGGAGSASASITVSCPNTPPVISNVEAGTLSYEAGTPPVPVTSSLTLSSSATSNLAGATVTASSGFSASQDLLSFTNQSGITGSYNSATGVLTLSGTASVADYQSALRSVTYVDGDGASPTTGNRVISFQVNDGLASGNLSNVASRTITVEPNSPPVAGAVSASTDNHTAIDINVLASASDPDGDPVTVTATTTSGTLGLVSINTNGTVHYDPNGKFNGLSAGQTATDSFGFTVSDGFHTSSSTVTVTISGPDAVTVASPVVTLAPVDDEVGGSSSGNFVADSGAVSSGGNTVRVSSVSFDLATSSSGLGLTAAPSVSLGNETVNVYSGTVQVPADLVVSLDVNLATGDFMDTIGAASESLPVGTNVVEFDVALTDGTASGDGALNLQIVGDGSSPVVSSVETSAVGYTTGGTPAQITSALTLSDGDDFASLVGATVAISSGFKTGDTLAFTNQNGITGTYDSATGVLTLSGTATLGQYQTALRSVQFESTSTISGTRTVTFTVNDGASTASAHRDITVTAT